MIIYIITDTFWKSDECAIVPKQSLTFDLMVGNVVPPWYADLRAFMAGFKRGFLLFLMV